MRIWRTIVAFVCFFGRVFGRRDACKYKIGQRMEENEMEKRILSSAKELFLKHGFDGVSTTQIAKKAGCNQALVHYYYRTKQRLLERILQEETATVFDSFSIIPHDDSPFVEKISKMVDAHFSFLENNPGIPMFLFGEMRSNPWIFHNFQSIFKERADCLLTELQKEIDKEVACGKIKAVEAFDLMFDIISFDVFSFMAKPFADIWEFSEEQKRNFLVKRKQHIKQILLSALSPKE